jgi:Cu(I)/Ag(I) efflux system membrane fusion protein
MYENRVIQLGIQNKKEVEVTGGLKEGELVVTSGAYLLNSALVLKKGTGMEGMKM